MNEVYDSGLSTYSDPARFYSYRRDKVTGRHGAVIYKQ
ncbi:laccase domain-containing protein [Turicimonas muris]|nr:laccase domain-containing protein [Turicimonas muris]